MLGSRKLAATLPRLLYIGDVPVEASYHGSALLYRLLERYPVDRLRIVEAGGVTSMAARRLKGVRYDDRRRPWLRLERTRFRALYGSLVLATTQGRVRQFGRIAREFRADAILSVAHGFACVAAAALAERIGVPLHLVCHDEWAQTVEIRGDAARKEHIFEKVYVTAASRLCVSPFMAQEYASRYGAAGSVLYPSRASDALTFDRPPPRLARTGGDFVCAYAGSVNSREYAVALKRLADCLGSLDGRLLIYGPMDPALANYVGLTTANVEFCGLLPSRSLIENLRERADVLFVPMSFSLDHRANMEVSFPSKLTDYSAVGLPLLVYGPEYCSAARWARANAPVAEVVDQEGGEALTDALKRLADNPTHRVRLAQSAIVAGDRYFSHEAAWNAFSAALGVADEPHPFDRRSAAGRCSDLVLEE